MLIDWWIEKHVTYLMSIYKVVKIKIDTKKKMAKEEKHWEVGNLNMTLFHKKDGKLWLSYF
jgi:hypothetical protein